MGYALKVMDGIELFERRLTMRQRETGRSNNRDDSSTRQHYNDQRDRSNDRRGGDRDSSPPLWKEPRLDRGRQAYRNGDGWGRYDDQYSGNGGQGQVCFYILKKYY